MSEINHSHVGTTWPSPAQGTTWLRRGTTWLSPARGTTWLAAMLVCMSMLAGSIASTGTTDQVAAAAPGMLSPSSDVEMLLADPGSTVATLDQLRSILLNDAATGDGSGVDVALIDTGVAPVNGLTGSHKVIYGPDLSLEASNPDLTHLDTYGHGTHMAGIIAGERAGSEGLAPGARLVSVKVAGSDGLTSVAQVVAAIDWVVEHRNSDGLNIRVLNLSFGQSGVSNHFGDQLSASVERAWQAGIFVVVAAGNDGTTQLHLDSPAIDPYVIAVAAADSVGGTRPNFFDVPSWSAHGDGVRNPDVVGIGRTVASYGVPGSTIDTAAPWARYGDGLFLGSGTSQAAASVSGVAAAILSSNPHFSNDDLKRTFRANAADLRKDPEVTSGKGVVDAYASLRRPKNDVQVWPLAAGLGSGIVAPTSGTWSAGTWSAGTWSSGTWSGTAWSGGTWSSGSWSAGTWSAGTWSSGSWSGGTWSAGTWSGGTWSGGTWSGSGWS